MSPCWILEFRGDSLPYHWGRGGGLYTPALKVTFESNVEACITDTPLRMHTDEGMATIGKVATGVFLIDKSVYSIC